MGLHRPVVTQRSRLLGTPLRGATFMVLQNSESGVVGLPQQSCVNACRPTAARRQAARRRAKRRKEGDLSDDDGVVLGRMGLREEPARVELPGTPRKTPRPVFENKALHKLLTETKPLRRRKDGSVPAERDLDNDYEDDYNIRRAHVYKKYQ